MLHSKLLSYQLGKDVNHWLVICNAAGALIVQPLDVGQKLLNGLARQNMTTDIHGKSRLHLLARQSKIGGIQVICLSSVFDRNYMLWWDIP